MKTQFKKGDLVTYGNLRGKVMAVWPKEKVIEADFMNGKERVCVLFDRNGIQKDFGTAFDDNPILKKTAL